MERGEGWFRLRYSDKLFLQYNKHTWLLLVLVYNHNIGKVPVFAELDDLFNFELCCSLDKLGVGEDGQQFCCEIVARLDFT